MRAARAGRERGKDASSAIQSSSSVAVSGVVAATKGRTSSADANGASQSARSATTAWGLLQPVEFPTEFSHCQHLLDGSKRALGSGTAVAHKARPPSSRSTSAARNGGGGTSALKLEDLPGVVAPVKADGGLVYHAPGHPLLVTQHVYSKACRQYERRVHAFRFNDAALRIQAWFRRVVVVRRRWRQMRLATRVGVLVRRIARLWRKRAQEAAIAKRALAARLAQQQPRMDHSATLIARAWRGLLARRKFVAAKQAHALALTDLLRVEARAAAATKIQTCWKMTKQRRRTRLARSSLKHFRLGRAVHQVRLYFFRRQRERIRDTVASRENRAAEIIQSAWHSYCTRRHFVSTAFMDKVFRRVC